MKLKIIILLFILNLGCKGETKEQNIPNNTINHECDNNETFPDLKSDKSISLTQNWITEPGLKQVECVLYDTENQVLYASNGEDYKVGNDGFISKISTKGDILELKWIEGLNRPTGMALYNGKLYVADVNALVVIDTKTGEILQKIKEVIKGSGLNDVAVNSKGKVFVTASFIHSVFKLYNGSLQLLAKDENSLKWVNGIFAMEDELLVGGLNLASIDITSKKITENSLHPLVEDFDGITSDGLGGYFLTTVENSGLWHSDNQNHIKKILSDNGYYGDLEFVPSLNTIFVARGNIKSDNFFIAAYSID